MIRGMEKLMCLLDVILSPSLPCLWKLWPSQRNKLQSFTAITNSSVINKNQGGTRSGNIHCPSWPYTSQRPGYVQWNRTHCETHTGSDECRKGQHLGVNIPKKSCKIQWSAHISKNSTLRLNCMSSITGSTQRHAGQNPDTDVSNRPWSGDDEPLYRLSKKWKWTPQ